MGFNIQKGATLPKTEGKIYFATTAINMAATGTKDAHTVPSGEIWYLKSCRIDAAADDTASYFIIYSAASALAYNYEVFAAATSKAEYFTPPLVLYAGDKIQWYCTKVGGGGMTATALYQKVLI